MFTNGIFVSYMRIPFFITLLYASLFGFGQDSLKTKLPKQHFGTQVLNLTTEIPNYNKLEIGVQIPQHLNSLFLSDSLNPFDAKHINIEANFVSPTGLKNKKVYGFFYQEYKRNEHNWELKPSKTNWRIRFAPNEVGTWKTYIKVTIKGEQFLDTINFTCIPSTSKGFIELANKQNKTNRYLQFSETKESFFAIGENMVWPSFQKLRPSDMKAQFTWMNELANSGGNFLRLGIIPDAFGFEWEQLGNYSNRMTQAWELDKVFEKAEELDLYLLLWLDIHGQFTAPPWQGEMNSWDNNPYRKFIPEVKTPIDFLTNPTAKEYYKQKLRYLVSRWGYSTSIAVWEPLSEIDNFMLQYNKSGKQGDLERKVVNDWYKEIKNYYVADLQETRPVSGSFTGGETDKIDDKIFSHLDISFLHKYGHDKKINKRRYKKTQTLLNHKKTQFKPILFNEFGAAHTPNLDYASDITLHNSIWASSFSGSFGCGLTWWWDSAIHRQGWQKNFKGLSSFFKNENFTTTEYTPHFYQSNFWSFYKSDLQMHYLQSDNKDRILGWLHNSSYWWWNLQDRNDDIKALLAKSNPRIDPADTREYNHIKHHKKDRGVLNPSATKQLIIKFKGLKSQKYYAVNWYNTVTGEHILALKQKVKCVGGKIKVAVPDIQNHYGDFGFKITSIN